MSQDIATSGIGSIANGNTPMGMGAIINGLGDSITAESQYQASAVPPATVPAWAANTAYTNLSSVVQNGGNIYQCIQTGTSASSGGPTGTAASFTDNGAKWVYVSARSVKFGNSFLAWAEKFSLGRLYFDLSQGYTGVLNTLVKVLVISKGVGYVSADTITFNNGAHGTLVLDANGGITGVIITDSGGGNGTTAFTYSLTTSTGSGAVLSLVGVPSGTFAVGGCVTADMVARLPDVLASAVDIVTVLGGINDITSSKTVATITANLKICYDTLIAAGKKVIAIPILPCAGLTTAQMIVLQRSNRWIRAYCRKEAWANTYKNGNIMLADPTRYWSDGSGAPIGGTGVVANAMTLDGKHPSPRGAQYIAIAVLKAAERWIGAVPDSPGRTAAYLDGYDPVTNPTGNVLEGLPWVASTAYAVGQLVTNDTSPVKIYRVRLAGTSAGSGGPTGTSGGDIVDGGVTWRYVSGIGASSFGSGTAGTLTNPGGSTTITMAGSVATGWTLSRSAGGSATTGNITCAIESPWSDGQIGTRQSIQFELGGGSVNEQWLFLAINAALPVKGLQLADAGVAMMVAEAEVEISNVANLVQLYLRAGDTTDQYSNDDGSVASTQLQGMQMMQSNGEMLPIPNNGKFLLRTQPMLLPATVTAQNLWFVIGFDTSGGAGTATCLLKVNRIELRKAAIL